MKNKSILIVGGALLSLSISAHAATARAILSGTSAGSALAGTVNITETKSGLEIDAKIENAPPGKHGFHIHAFGDCGQNGKGAGGHFNPNKTSHGFLPKDGIKKAHAGDLGNIQIDENGKGSLEMTVPKLSLSKGPYNIAGRAFILHGKPDDFGQPTGNAGARIGCGPIVLTKP